jgi:hypothetical protein
MQSLPTEQENDPWRHRLFATAVGENKRREFAMGESQSERD